MNTAIPLGSTEFDIILQHTLRGSRYAQRLLDSDPELLPWLRMGYATPCTAAEMATWLGLLSVADEASLSRTLRILRKRVLLKLLTRDLGGLADLGEVMACMTALAEITIQQAQAFVMQALVAQHGQPLNAQGVPQEMLVLGMGKLGGRELNVSSDIDLIFIYP